ncbi:MAG TPA: UDP-3-O-(3-hydroxymyristoyl)glucosamine N-acyltransferase [Acidobacteriaceae bacterium]|nr:UDP-3-O-(3-hydroxymyristoyl)glucosamine N-acyltransferase [Acidobacteriaceae bacterium]
MKPHHPNHLTLNQLAELVGSAPAKPSPAKLTGVAAVEDADAHSIVFAQDEPALHAAIASKAGAILASRNRLTNPEAFDDPRILWVRDPRYAMAAAARALTPQPTASEIHPSAIIHPTAKLGARARIGAGTVIEANAILGDDCTLAANVTICQGVHIGHRVVVQSGAVLGSFGFGYARNRDTGEYLLFPQQGTLVIEDDVDIGANTTIDRGALGETRIGSGTKLDNLVHIGHNCRIGKNVIMAAQVGISGSCTIDDGAILAGQVGLGDHVHIGPGVVLGGQGGVFPGKEITGTGQVFAGTPAEPLANYLKSLARVRRLK